MHTNCRYLGVAHPHSFMPLFRIAPRINPECSQRVNQKLLEGAKVEPHITFPIA
jgi:hypothetical protein